MDYLVVEAALSVDDGSKIPGELGAIDVFERQDLVGFPKAAGELAERGEDVERLLRVENRPEFLAALLRGGLACDVRKDGVVDHAPVLPRAVLPVFYLYTNRDHIQGTFDDDADFP